MSPPIDSATKERVIQKHLEGLGRNEIARELGISTGSVSNILKTNKDPATGLILIKE